MSSPSGSSHSAHYVVSPVAGAVPDCTLSRAFAGSPRARGVTVHDRYVPKSVSRYRVTSHGFRRPAALLSIAGAPMQSVAMASVGETPGLSTANQQRLSAANPQRLNTANQRRLSAANNALSLLQPPTVFSRGRALTVFTYLAHRNVHHAAGVSALAARRATPVD